MDDVVHLPPIVEVGRIDVYTVHLIPDGEVFDDSRVFGVECSIRVKGSCRFHGQGTLQEDSQCK